MGSQVQQCGRDVLLGARQVGQHTGGMQQLTVQPGHVSLLLPPAGLFLQVLAALQRIARAGSPPRPAAAAAPKPRRHPARPWRAAFRRRRGPIFLLPAAGVTGTSSLDDRPNGSKRGQWPCAGGRHQQHAGRDLGLPAGTLACPLGTEKDKDRDAFR
jgi:hypothetical protein